jgi:predicted dehydrogenase
VSRTGTARRGDGRRGFGIIGAGVIADLHAEAITGLDGARMVAVTDVIGAQAADLGRRYGGAVEASAAALLARDDIELVFCAQAGQPPGSPGRRLPGPAGHV